MCGRALGPRQGLPRGRRRRDGRQRPAWGPPGRSGGPWRPCCRPRPGIGRGPPGVCPRRLPRGTRPRLRGRAGAWPGTSWAVDVRHDDGPLNIAQVDEDLVEPRRVPLDALVGVLAQDEAALFLTPADLRHAL